MTPGPIIEHFAMECALEKVHNHDEEKNDWDMDRDFPPSSDFMRLK